MSQSILFKESTINKNKRPLFNGSTTQASQQRTDLFKRSTVNKRPLFENETTSRQRELESLFKQNKTTSRQRELESLFKQHMINKRPLFENETIRQLQQPQIASPSSTLFAPERRVYVTRQTVRQQQEQINNQQAMQLLSDTFVSVANELDEQIENQPLHQDSTKVAIRFAAANIDEKLNSVDQRGAFKRLAGRLMDTVSHGTVNSVSSVYQKGTAVVNWIGVQNIRKLYQLASALMVVVGIVSTVVVAYNFGAGADDWSEWYRRMMLMFEVLGLGPLIKRFAITTIAPALLGAMLRYAEIDRAKTRSISSILADLPISELSSNRSLFRQTVSKVNRYLKYGIYKGLDQINMTPEETVRTVMTALQIYNGTYAITSMAENLFIADKVLLQEQAGVLAKQIAKTQSTQSALRPFIDQIQTIPVIGSFANVPIIAAAASMIPARAVKDYGIRQGYRFINWARDIPEQVQEVVGERLRKWYQIVMRQSSSTAAASSIPITPFEAEESAQDEPRSQESEENYESKDSKSYGDSPTQFQGDTQSKATEQVQVDVDSAVQQESDIGRRELDALLTQPSESKSIEEQQSIWSKLAPLITPLRFMQSRPLLSEMMASRITKQIVKLMTVTVSGIGITKISSFYWMNPNRFYQDINIIRLIVSFGGQQAFRQLIQKYGLSDASAPKMIKSFEQLERATREGKATEKQWRSFSRRFAAFVSQDTLYSYKQLSQLNMNQLKTIAERKKIRISPGLTKQDVMELIYVSQAQAYSKWHWYLLRETIPYLMDRASVVAADAAKQRYQIWDQQQLDKILTFSKTYQSSLVPVDEWQPYLDSIQKAKELGNQELWSSTLRGWRDQIRSEALKWIAKAETSGRMNAVVQKIKDETGRVVKSVTLGDIVRQAQELVTSSLDLTSQSVWDILSKLRAQIDPIKDTWSASEVGEIVQFLQHADRLPSSIRDTTLRELELAGQFALGLSTDEKGNLAIGRINTDETNRILRQFRSNLSSWLKNQATIRGGEFAQAIKTSLSTWSILTDRGLWNIIGTYGALPTAIESFTTIEERDMLNQLRDQIALAGWLPDETRTKLKEAYLTLMNVSNKNQLDDARRDLFTLWYSQLPLSSWVDKVDKIRDKVIQDAWMSQFMSASERLGELKNVPDVIRINTMTSENTSLLTIMQGLVRDLIGGNTLAKEINPVLISWQMNLQQIADQIPKHEQWDSVLKSLPVSNGYATVADHLAKCQDIIQTKLKDWLKSQKAQVRAMDTDNMLRNYLLNDILTFEAKVFPAQQAQQQINDLLNDKPPLIDLLSFMIQLQTWQKWLDLKDKFKVVTTIPPEFYDPGNLLGDMPEEWMIKPFLTDELDKKLSRMITLSFLAASTAVTGPDTEIAEAATILAEIIKDIDIGAAAMKAGAVAQLVGKAGVVAKISLGQLRVQDADSWIAKPFLETSWQSISNRIGAVNAVRNGASGILNAVTDGEIKDVSDACIKTFSEVLRVTKISGNPQVTDIANEIQRLSNLELNVKEVVRTSIALGVLKGWSAERIAMYILFQLSGGYEIITSSAWVSAAQLASYPVYLVHRLFETLDPDYLTSG